MKFCVAFVALLIVGNSFVSPVLARSGDTLRVTVFKDYFWKNLGYKDEGALFPGEGQSYEKVLMRFTLAAPKDTSAGRWDYTMRVFCRKFSATNSDTEQYEIGRFITPYGGWFKSPWRHTWTMDVTPYTFLLHDSVEIRVEYQGYTQGSLFSLDFDCIEGRPLYAPYKIENLWNGSFVYGDRTNPIEKSLAPKSVRIDKDADIVILRLFTTGHGFGTDGAAEFTDKTHHIAINDTVRFTQHLWRTDCGQNPLYPQAGTWYYSRGGWCPGDMVHPWDFDITPYVKAGDYASIAYRMAQYTNLEKTPANYLIAAELIYAKGPASRLDAGVEDILAPSGEFEHRRSNPICSLDTERVVIRNWGSEDLRTVTINYGIDANLASAYLWNGNLKFMDTAIVSLPGIDLPVGDRYFSVHLERPNNGEDENSTNDVLSVPYSSVKSYTSPLNLKLQIDKVLPKDSVPNSIVYDLFSESGDHLYHNAGFRDSEFVRDTFQLDPGCYHFIIQDTGMSESGGDGLYPIFKGASPGYFRLTDFRDSTIEDANTKNKLANFGPYQILTFNISADSSRRRSERLSDPRIEIHQDQKRGEIEIDCHEIRIHGSEYTRVSVSDLLDQIVFSKALEPNGVRRVLVSMKGQPSGTYFVRVESRSSKHSQKFEWGSHK